MAKILLQLPRTITLSALPAKLTPNTKFTLKGTSEQYVLIKAPLPNSAIFTNEGLEDLSSCYIIRKC
ncbi:hypothetical protein NEHOM01_1487 [Nematocida homosporus]|uniref:uncharacterized protein n=1 Tax=Nematocida homosporus TaxID=1912981 RepID=UPI0022204D30|nr:uncharacterized protein NEHOM01_1487 [Nematocida homosporus]KAI5186475.1 hypothetical protein NEHOM01_1487 [Nematocida homosporus]